MIHAAKKLTIVGGLLWAISAHAMHPEAPKKPRSCEERFIDALVVCHQSRWCMPYITRSLQDWRYQRCIKNLSVDERNRGLVSRNAHYIPITYFMPNFTAIGNDQILEGELVCEGCNGTGFECSIESHSSTTPIHNSIFPALRSLYEIQKRLGEEQDKKQEKLRKEQRRREQKEREDSMMRHRPR